MFVAELHGKKQIPVAELSTLDRSTKTEKKVFPKKLGSNA